MVSEPTGIRPGAEITAVDALVTRETGIGLVALATAASAQMMGNGQYWYSGDGGIPKFTATVDGDVSDM